MTALAVIFLFSVIIIIHELGHFWAARRAGVAVLNFNVGFGPVLWSMRKKGTEYALRLFPLGGSVQLAGLEDLSGGGHGGPPLSKRYDKKSLGQRALIISAGALCNIVLAFCIFVLVYSLLGVPKGVSATVAEVMPGSPAAQSGIQRGAMLLSVQGYQLGDPTKAVQIIHQTKPGTVISVVYLQNGKTIRAQIPVTYNAQVKASVTGLILSPGQYERVNVLQALWYGAEETIGFARMFIEGLAGLVSPQALQGMAGPVGIISISNEAASRGLMVYLRLMAMLSLNIGMLNLLPLPALDGGRLVFILWEFITRRKPNPEFEKYVHAAGLFLLLGLMLLITYQDIGRLLSK